MFFGVDHCQTPMQEIEQGKIPGMKLLKIGEQRFINAAQSPKKEPTFRRKPLFTCWGEKLRLTYRKFASDDFQNFDFLIVLYVFELSCFS